MIKYIFAFLFSSQVFAQTFEPVETKPILPEWKAAILGLVEGVTEYLPISSTGHLILTSKVLGLDDEKTLTTNQLDAVEAFEIVIQSGAILAVILIYFSSIRRMILGLLGKDDEGKKLFINIMSGLIPTLAIGFAFNKIIKQYLMNTNSVIIAMIVGGMIMVRWSKSKFYKNSRERGFSIAGLTPKTAAFIGLIQCLAMWPGTSRSMVTMLGGMVVGLNPIAAAEFSFLLGLPTLLAATAFKALKEGHLLVEHIGFSSMAVGLTIAAISAGISVKWLIQYLTKHGLEVFGWYRIVAGVILVLTFLI